MNVKKKLSLYFNIVTYISGTFILLTLLIIMTINFTNDARILAKPAPTEIEQNGDVNASDSENGSNNSGNDENNEGMQVYDRGFELVDSTVNGNLDNEEIKETDTTIEVINLTGIDIYADQLIASLVAFGYKPESNREYDEDDLDTIIIDRTGKELGKKIQNLLRFDNLIEEDKDDLSYDITIIIGKDFITPP